MLKDPMPYCFCPRCLKLAPIRVMNGERQCKVCDEWITALLGGRVVTFFPIEAKLRGLATPEEIL